MLRQITIKMATSVSHRLTTKPSHLDR